MLKMRHAILEQAARQRRQEPPLGAASRLRQRTGRRMRLHLLPSGCRRQLRARHSQQPRKRTRRRLTRPTGQLQRPRLLCERSLLDHSPLSLGFLQTPQNRSRTSHQQQQQSPVRETQTQR